MKIQPEAPPPDSGLTVESNSTPDSDGITQGDLAKLIRKQTEVLEQLLADRMVQAKSQDALSKDIFDVLKKIHDQHMSSDLTYKPLPPAPATSSSGWTPLLRAHLARIQPNIDRWRGTLDTLLVFIALFSAIVTTFFVQPLTGLSQDTGARTNELLQNLTDIYISVNAANAAQLNVSSPVPFEPEDSAVRLNFYWSISLILSISVAVLAVTSRGYVAMLSRSKHRAAHKKLGDLNRRWVQAERLLAPAIELLPQLLIIPVLLFIVGLLDSILSSTLPLSRVFLPIFVAGLLSCAFALVVAVYTVWTVMHGCIHPETSPFQSTLSQLLTVHGARLHMALQSAFAAFMGLYRSWLKKILKLIIGLHDELDHPLNSMEAGSTSLIPSQKEEVDDARLASHEIDAYHSALQQTHEDDIVDQAATIFRPSIQQPSPVGIRGSGMTRDEFSSLCYILSDEASIRTNITAARFIDSRSMTFGDLFNLDHCKLLLCILVKSANRYSFSLVGREHSHILWKCPFTDAIFTVVQRATMSSMTVVQPTSADVPIVGMLLCDLPVNVFQSADYESLPSHESAVIIFLLQVLHDKLRESDSQPFGLSDMSMLRLMDSEYSYIRDSLGRGDSLGSTVLEPFLMLALVGDLRWHIVTLRPLAYWMIEWFRDVSLLSLHELTAAAAVSVALDRTSAQWRSNPTQSSYSIQQKLKWLSFLWSTMNSAFSVELHSVRVVKPERYEDLLRLCVNSVQFFQDYDHAETRALFLPSYGSILGHQRDTKLTGPGPVCTPLCCFHTMISRSIIFVREGHPDLRLDPESWTRIISALGQTAGGLRYTDPDVDDWYRWTPVAHRDGIKKSVLEMFRKISPDAPADENNAAADITIPWEWLEESDHGVVKEPEDDASGFER